jgi:hypothetical protein
MLWFALKGTAAINEFPLASTWVRSFLGVDTTERPGFAKANLIQLSRFQRQYRNNVVLSLAIVKGPINVVQNVSEYLLVDFDPTTILVSVTFMFLPLLLASTFHVWIVFLFVWIVCHGDDLSQHSSMDIQ